MGWMRKVEGAGRGVVAVAGGEEEGDQGGGEGDVVEEEDLVESGGVRGVEKGGKGPVAQPGEVGDPS